MSLALPWLDASGTRAAALRQPRPPSRRAAWCASARRWACIPPFFFPEQAGQGLRAHALSGSRSRTSATTSRSSPACRIPDVGPSHDSIYSFLTAAPASRSAGPASATASRWTSSRPSTSAARRASPAWPCRARASACPGPAAAPPCRRISCPSSVFARLFLEGRPDEVQAQARRLRDGRSILDAVRDQARKMQAGPRRRRPRKARRVLHQRPRTGAAPGHGRGMVEEAQAQGRRQAAAEHHQLGRPHRQDPALFDLIHLALQTDSTRLITLLLLGTSGVPPIQGVIAGPSRPVAPRPGPEQDRAAQEASNWKR